MRICDVLYVKNGVLGKTGRGSWIGFGSHFEIFRNFFAREKKNEKEAIACCLES